MDLRFALSLEALAKLAAAEHIPAGSAGYLLDARRTGGDILTRADAADLLADLAPRNVPSDARTS